MIAEGAGASPIPGAIADERTEADDTARSHARRLSTAALVTLAIGLAVTAALAIAAGGVYRHNERRLLNLRVRELSLVVSGATQSVQTPLASAAALADATDGDPARFRALMTPIVGKGRQFASASLWPLGGGTPRARVTVGTPIASPAVRAAHVQALAHRPGVLNMVGLLGERPPALGFQYSAAPYAVFVESPLPANRRSRLESNSAFSDLDYAVYLGHGRHTSNLILTSVKHLPMTG